MTQLEAARKGVITPEMIRVAVRENVSPEFIRDGVARGTIVIPANVRHLAGSGGAVVQNAKCKMQNEEKSGNGRESAILHSELDTLHSPTGHPTATPDSAYWVNQTVAQRRVWVNDPEHCRGERAPKRLDPTGIGRSITTKINANQGASPVSSDTAEELVKLRHAILYGADTVMDLSTGGSLIECRQAIIDNSVVPVGTVPIYSMILQERERGTGNGERGTGRRGLEARKTAQNRLEADTTAKGAGWSASRASRLRTSPMTTSCARLSGRRSRGWIISPFTPACCASICR
jgi:thiamine biosynthesis protein ThiC